MRLCGSARTYQGEELVLVADDLVFGAVDERQVGGVGGRDNVLGKQQAAERRLALACCSFKAPDSAPSLAAPLPTGGGAPDAGSRWPLLPLITHLVLGAVEDVNRGEAALAVAVLAGLGDLDVNHLARLVTLHEDVAGLLDLTGLTRVPKGGSSVTGLVLDHVFIGHLVAASTRVVSGNWRLLGRRGGALWAGAVPLPAARGWRSDPRCLDTPSILRLAATAASSCCRRGRPAGSAPWRVGVGYEVTERAGSGGGRLMRREGKKAQKVPDKNNTILDFLYGSI